MEPYKKLNARKLSKEEFKTKDYFKNLNPSKARTKFAKEACHRKLRSAMLVVRI